jgi:histone-lysine N-methyltransferase SETMAR
MLSVWWGVKGFIHWKTLPAGCTVTADLYCQRLDRVAAKLHRKQDRIYFLHANATPYIAKLTREKLLKLGWITIPHPPYSPDLAPTDYHLFRPLSNYLGDKNFDDENDLKTDLANFFTKCLKTSPEAGYFLCQSVGGKPQRRMEHALLEASCIF